MNQIIFRSESKDVDEISVRGNGDFAVLNLGGRVEVFISWSALDKISQESKTALNKQLATELPKM